MTGRQQTKRGAWAMVRKTLLLVVGGALTLVGLVLLVVPGPGIPLVIAGLAVMAPEFPWARRQKDRITQAGRSLLDKRRGTEDERDSEAA